MSSSSDPRVQELTRLRLALATFAVQLNAFEERTHGFLRSLGPSKNDGLPGRQTQRGDRIVGQ